MQTTVTHNATTAAKKVDGPRNDAVAFLAGLNHGNLPHAMAEKLEEIVLAVNATGKPGRIVLEVIFSPEPKLGPGALRIEASLDKSKTPRPAPENQFRFATDDGRVIEDDPRQQKFNFASEKPAA